MDKYLREPVNSLTHAIGAVLSLIGFIAMIVKVALTNGNATEYLAICLFGIGMILLYSASATYHSVISSDKVIKSLKKLDHSMIFLLIAGSYAPFCLIALHNSIGYALFAAVGIASVIGIIFKLVWINCPKWLSSTIYIVVGWFAAFAIYPLSQVLTTLSLVLLVAGGILYSIGGIIYALKKDAIKIGIFGSHEIFHIFIMLGTLCHFIAVFAFIL